MVLSALITVIFGILLGIIICIPIGPINLITIKLTAKNKRTDALFLALGGSAMDVVYFLVFLLGLSFIDFSEKTTYIFKSLGISFIFLLGLIEVIKYFRDKKIMLNQSSKDIDAVVKRTSKTSGFLSFVSGVVIYTSNPTLVASMSALSAFVKSSALVPMTLPFIILFSAFAGIGTFLWFVFLTGLVVRYKNKFNDRFMLKLNLAFGILIMIVAIVMATKLILA